MLTVKAPIELKCRAGIVPSYEGFVRRITGNYEMMSAAVTGEDLLHAVTEPQEVFFAEGSVSTVINQTNINQNQENKLEILNQLLNRITINPGLHMTYQDRVYITDMLQKMGIKNVRQFMHQVTQLKEETENTTELIDHYWNHMEQLQKLIQNYKESREEKTENSDYRQEESILHLHQDIMNRLQTGSIYQIVSNFNRTQYAPVQRISGDELRTAEYYRITRNILLNTLENEAKGENLPLEYRHENYYEEILPLTEEITEEKITNRIAAAVLLQLADNIYQNRHESVERRGDSWYTMSNAFYRSAENTMNRLHRNYVEQYYRNDRAGDYLVSLNENYRQELALLDRITTIRETADERAPATSVQTTVKLEDTQLYQKEDTYQNLTDNSFYREGDRHYLNQTGGTTEERNYRQDFSNEELYLNREQNSFGNTEVSLRQEQQEVTLEQLEEFHRHNVENRNRYYQMMNQLKKQQEKPGKSPDLQRMRREGLLALEHPQELLQQLKEEGSGQQEQAARLRQQELKLLPEETQRIYEVLEQYLQMPERFRQTEVATNRDIGRLMRDIELVERDTREQIQTEIHTDRQVNSSSETVEQSWLGTLREEPHYDERSVNEVQVENPESRPAGLPEGTERVERLLREVEQVHTNTERQVNSSSETVEQSWRERPSAELYYDGTEKAAAGKAAPQGRETEPARDREPAERQLREQELIHSRTDRQLKDISETVVERWEENFRREPVQSRTTEEDHRDRISLVHKLQTENEITEEIMEQLMNQNRVLENQTRVMEEVTQNSRTVERRVTNQTTHEITQQTENLTEMISRGVQGRIGDITDQVYSRLEKRLQNERRRRGI